MTQAMKWEGDSSSTDNVGAVAYEYCLSCDGALSKRFEFGAGSGSSAGALASGYRFEYDGLNLLRMDQLYDSNSNGLTESDAWRKLWVGTYRPGQIAGLVGKRVYTYSSGTSGTPSGKNDYTYAYDPVGNTVAVFNANTTGRGDETYAFTQDAFGLELSNNSSVRISERTNLFGATQRSTARTAGVWEHQTGKWIDPFTGDYFFHARWYDAAVGRFVGRSLLSRQMEHPYSFCFNAPLSYVDKDGQFPFFIAPVLAVLAHYIAEQGACAALASLPGMIEAWVGESNGAVHDDPEDPASSNKWPRTHCMWNCYMERWCGPGTAETASLIKEVIDLAVCIVSGSRGNCWSAFQDADSDANEAGREAANRPDFSCCAVGCDKRGWPLGEPEKPAGPWWTCRDKWFCLW